MLPSLTTWQFALAGLVAAAGPVVIHLLTRHRHRRVEWGAMELLLQAARESRRSIQLRDLAILCLRCLAVALFGLALAQPFVASDTRQLSGGRPAELTILLDNSLSMGYESLAGSRMEAAIHGARRTMERMPPGSRFRVVPLCGTVGRDRVELTPLLEEALAVLNAVRVVDRSLTMSQILDAAREACQTPTSLDRRLVLFSDLQAGSWKPMPELSGLAELPGIDVVNVATEEDWENTSVTSLELDDGVAFADAESTIRIRLENHVAKTREVQLDLNVDGVPVASLAMTLSPLETEREVEIRHAFGPLDERDLTQWVSVGVTVTPDQLSLDDRRQIVIPVIAKQSLIFVDQYGVNENAETQQVGETWPLRKLLAASQYAASGSLEFPHLRIGQLNRLRLANARVVVIAGVADPGETIPLLRQFVLQGGQLLIAAGGEFDPATWTERAWSDGKGILPAPLDAEFLGVPAGEVRYPSQPFGIDPRGIEDHPLLAIADSTPEELQALLSEPLFFRAIKPSVDGSGPGAPEKTPAERWLRWQPRLSPVNELLDAAPYVVARFDDDSSTPYLVERRIGAGRVVLLTSGLRTEWNTVSSTSAVVIYDHIVRHLLNATFDSRTHPAVDQLDIPLPGANLATRVMLQRPGHREASEPLDIGFIGENRRGTTISRLTDRGIYHLKVSDQRPDDRVERQISLAVNGNATESDLTQLSSAQQENLFATERLNLVESVDGISVGGSTDLIWWQLATAVLGMLLLEMIVIARRAQPKTARETPLA